MKKLFFAVVAAFALSGCAMQGALDNAGTSLLVRAGTAEYIGGDADTAQSVIAWTNDALALLDGNPVVLVEKLQDFAMRSIPWQELSPGRRIIAVETLRYVEAELMAGVIDGKLPPDATVGLRDLIETARWAAEFELGLAQQ